MTFEPISNGENHSQLTSQQVNEIIETTASVAKRFVDTTTAAQEELKLVNEAIAMWEHMGPQLYQMRKRLILAEEILSGKRKLEGLAGGITETEVQPQKKKRGPAKGTKTFIKKKSDILTDQVIEIIRDYIASDQEYHKAKDIYKYLLAKEIIQPFTGPKPEHAFAIALARVDQDLIKYNDHYSVMAWGLPDFGTAEHQRRKALSGRANVGTRVSSYGREPVAAGA